MTTARVRAAHPLAAVWAGIAMLALLLVCTPRAVEIDIGGIEPATLTGVYASDQDYLRRIRWTDGRARVEWPGALGVLPARVDVELASYFGRAGDQVLLSTGAPPLTRHTLTGEWDVVSLPVPEGHRRVVLDVLSDTHDPPRDDRVLGVRLDRIAIVNAPWWQVMSTIVWWQALVVVLLGATAWRAGLWLETADGPSAATPRGGVAVALACALTALLWWGRPWLLQPSGLRALAGAAVVGVALAVVLRRGRHLPRRLVAGVALVCSAIWLAMALGSLTFFVDVPRWDIWDSVRLIEKHHAGTLTLADFWSAHNEHRPLTARVVIFASVWLAHWNHWIELGAQLAVYALLLMLVASFVVRTQTHRLAVHPASLVAIAVVVFSATQWENWLRGYHVHIVMGAVATVAALLLLCVGPQRPSRLAGAMGLGLVAELSFGSGLIVWPLGAVALVVRRGQGWPARLAVWSVVSALAIGLYFPGLPHRPGLSEVAVSSGFETLRVAVGALVSIAMPLVYAPDVFAGPADIRQAAVVGVAGLAVVLAFGLIALRWRQDVAVEYTWLFPALLVAFGLGSGTLAAMGRASMGLYALTASRYIVYAGCFWTGLFLLLAMRPAGVGRVWSRTAAIVSVALAMTAAMSWAGAVRYMEADAAAGRRARAALLRGDIAGASVVLFPHGPELARMTEVLRRHQLSVFRPGAH